MSQLFWAMAPALASGITLLMNWNMRDVVARDPVLGPEARQFALRYWVFFTIPFVILGLLQYLGGFSTLGSLVCSRDLKSPYVAAAWLTLVLSWLVMLLWVWIGGGAHILLRYRGLLLSIPSTPLRIQLAVTGLVVLSISMWVVGMRFRLG